MKRILTLIALAALVCGTANRSQAVELLTSGNFENPGGATGEVPFWTLNETVTGSSASVDSAQIDGPATDSILWFKPFAGGTGLGTAQGNFDGDGDVDGRDFLIWQRGGSPTAGSAADLAAWQSNYGTSGGANKVNARLIQTVPAVAGDTYTFQGNALFEEYYSGLVTTLGDASPFAGQASPTVTQFRMEFLNASNNVIGSPFITDLRPIVTFPGFYTSASVQALSPAGTTSVRVVAEALDMVWNGSSAQVDPEAPGNDQSAFFNDFTLTRASAPSTQLLENGDLNFASPTALDFWNQQETPATRTEILRTASFANHTPSGTLGVWYSAFFGAHPNFEPNPVSGSISQTIQADAGSVFNFSGWSRFEGGYSGGVDTIDPTSTGFYAGQTSPTETTIKLEFLDINEAVISSSVIDVEAARKALGGGVANDNQWRQHFFNGAVAPANTEFVRISANMTDAVFNKDVGGALGNQSIFFDDFTLDGPGGMIALFAVPEPTSLALVGFGLAACGLCRGSRKS
jgi:hypothetical protein